MAKQAAARERKVMSLDPDTWVEGGLPSNFIGTIEEVRCLPHRFKDTDNEGREIPHKLFVRVTISVDPDEGVKSPQIQWYSAGDLKNWLPSKDGYEPVDIVNGEEGSEELEGVCFYRAGASKEGSRSTNYADFIQNALKAGMPKELLAEGNIDAMEGIVARFERVPKMERKGSNMQLDPGSKSDGKILVITEIVSLPGAKKGGSGKSGAGGSSVATAAAKAKAKSKVVEEDEDTDDEEAEAEGNPIYAQLDEILLSALADAEDEPIDKAALPKIVSAAWKGKGKVDGMSQVQQKDYLRAKDRPFKYDPEEAQISLR